MVHVSKPVDPSELVATVETYLDNDGNVAATAQQLFTHRHTIRYRLERVRDGGRTAWARDRRSASAAVTARTTTVP